MAAQYGHEAADLTIVLKPFFLAQISRKSHIAYGIMGSPRKQKTCTKPDAAYKHRN